VSIIEAFTVELLTPVDCSNQTITVQGDAVAPIVREIGKNYGLQTLLSSSETQGFFSVSRTEDDCAIIEYNIFVDTSNKVTSTDDLYTRLDVANYEVSSGLVKIDTDLQANQPEISVVFYI
jgi:hypothetical protein